MQVLDHMHELHLWTNQYVVVIVTTVRRVNLSSVYVRHVRVLRLTAFSVKINKRNNI